MKTEGEREYKRESVRESEERECVRERECVERECKRESVRERV
jgi:hypothetical protein